MNSSLKKHFVDIVNEPKIMKSDMILLQQTCLQKNENQITIEGYRCHLNSWGNGKGIAIFYKQCFELQITDINKTYYQISKMQSAKFDIICV